MTNPISPVTQTNNTALFATFKRADIIQLYNQQLDMDVSRFFKDTPEFCLYKCNETGYKFYYPMGLDGDGLFYESLQQHLGKDYYHEWKFENQMALDEIVKKDKVLDIGCGVGNFISRAKEKTSEVYGLELNEKAVSVCVNKGLKVYRELVQDHAKTHQNFYDVVCMFQVLEHVQDVKEFIDASLSVLKKGGKLIIGVPNNEPYFLSYDKYCTLNLPPHHMGLWNKKVFDKFCAFFNVSLLKYRYDSKGRILTHAYLRAKYLAGVKSLAGRHTTTEKLKIMAVACLTLPLTFMKKIFKGLPGSHIALVLQKQ